MSEELERSIRRKIAELQIYLGSGRATDQELEIIDRNLAQAVEVIVDPEARSATCGTS